MEVAAAVPFKFKRRSIDAVRTWPKGCGPIARKSTEAAAPAVDLSEPSEASRAAVSNGLPPGSIDELVQITEAPKFPDNDEVDAVFSEKVVKLEAPDSSKRDLDLLPQSDQVFSAKVVKLEAAGSSKGGLDQLPQSDQGFSAKLKTPDLSKRDLDQLPQLDQGETAEAQGNQCYSTVYPPPKKRTISAIRDFPFGCGRIAFVINSAIHDFPLDCGSNAPIIKVVSAAAPTKKDEINVNREWDDDSLQETTSVEPQENSASVPLTRKSLDSERKPMDISVASSEKVKRTDMKQIREGSKEVSNEARVKSIPKNQTTIVDEHGEKKILARVTSDKQMEGRGEKKILARVTSEKNMEGHDEKKILARVTSEKKMEGRYEKQISRNVSGKDTQESMPSLNAKSLDARPHSGSKAVVKQGGSSKGKLVEKGPMKHHIIGKNLKRKSLEEKENKGCSANEEVGRELALNPNPDRLIVQALMAAPNCPWRQSKKSGGFSFRAR